MARCAIAAVVLAVAATAGAAASTTMPALRLLARAPVAVAGVHFRPRERVRVTITANASRHVTAARTTSRGSFRVELPTVYVGRCAGLRAVAVGAGGDSAHLKVLPLPACISQ